LLEWHNIKDVPTLCTQRHSWKKANKIGTTNFFFVDGLCLMHLFYVIYGYLWSIFASIPQFAIIWLQMP
jgi:hypothetical protein